MLVDSDDVEALEALLARHGALGHRCVNKDGNSLTIVSGDPSHKRDRITALG